MLKNVKKDTLIMNGKIGNLREEIQTIKKK